MSASAAQQGTAHSVDLRNDPDFWCIVRCAMVRTSLQAEQHILLLADIDCIRSSLATACIALCREVQSKQGLRSQNSMFIVSRRGILYCSDLSQPSENGGLLLQGSTQSPLCKYGLSLLQAALPPAAQKAPPWSSFLALYELLDEYALHLIQVSFWSVMDTLSNCNVTPLCFPESASTLP